MQIDRPILEVWNRVIDANEYPEWLIGAQAVVVPDEWPAPTATFRHRIGFGPLTIPGSTTSRVCEPPSRFALAAGMGLLGASDVVFELTEGGGSTKVMMTEHPVRGPVRFAYRFAWRFVERSIDERNIESLRKLRDRIVVAP